MVRFLTEDFETGSLATNSWLLDLTDVGPDIGLDTINIVSLPVHGGQYSCELHAHGNDPPNAFASIYKTYLEMDRANIRSYLNFQTVPPDAWKRTILMAVRTHTTYKNLAVVTLRRRDDLYGSSEPYEIVLRIDPSLVPTVFPTDSIIAHLPFQIQIGVWYYFEVEYRRDAVNGGFQVFAAPDGQPFQTIISELGYNTSASPPTNMLEVGLAVNNYDAIMAIDNVVFADEFIGPTGYVPNEWTVTINNTAPAGIPVTLNGSSAGVTPLNVLVQEGNHVFEVPIEVTINMVTQTFQHWLDGNGNVISTSNTLPYYVDMSLSLTPVYQSVVTPESTITGVIRDVDTQTPIDQAVVNVDGNQTLTGADGVYSLVVPLGVYTVSATKTGYTIESSTVDASVEGVYTQNFDLSPTEPTPEPPIPLAALLAIPVVGGLLYWMFKRN